MSDSIPRLLDSARLLFELQRSHQIAQSFAGRLQPEEIARCVTDGAIEQFDCALARIWLVESDRTALRLVASSGLYTHTNGSFARVPMGAFKVGKIAQNCVSFLSNQLSEETWVKDRDWAIANQIRGFAGYPLIASGEAIGVLAIFSHQPLAAEFLEVLQGLCTAVTVALQTALQYQKDKQAWQAIAQGEEGQVLSDRLARLLGTTRLTMLGTERSLGPSHTYLFLQAAEILNRVDCNYCRLTYDSDAVSLEAIAGLPAEQFERSPAGTSHIETAFEALSIAIHTLGGVLQLQTSREQAVLQVFLRLPNLSPSRDIAICIRCQQPVLQLAFTQLAYLAGLTVAASPAATIPILSDSPEGLAEGDRLLWIQVGPGPKPAAARACLDLSVTPPQLRQAIETVMQGETWGLETPMAKALSISTREREIVGLLAAGLRDRDIARQLHISESTVKFHINKVLVKLNARTRYQVLHQLTAQGWL
ncbi:GAF domain-containing protein [Synechococcus sp. PCC 7336]|uniref:LuxR C-terminal-related transcriptional regulator n=1 Tax=Synechococcus sp. PCC 7336 TaxID=195250 RepID=UPI00034C692E|nr:GAF domain-containing protein [Synechococcus sp. PCC 7336]